MVDDVEGVDSVGPRAKREAMATEAFDLWCVDVPVGLDVKGERQLAGKEFDTAYENPWDTALAAYLWLLNATEAQRAALAATRVRDCPHCWWAKQVAEQVLSANSLPTNGTAGTTTPARTA